MPAGAPTDNSQHVNYLDAAGHVHELYIHPGAAGWVDNDLTQFTGGTPAVAGSALDGYWGSDNSQHVNYLDAAGHVHELYIAAPPHGAPVMLGDVATYDSGNLTSDLPLQGSVHVVFDEKGDFTFTSHAHDSGFDNIDYAVAAVILTASGIAFTFQHLGGVEGTSAGLPFGKPRRDDPYTASGTDQKITNEWPSIPDSSMAASINGSDALVGGIEGELGKLLDSLLQELGKAAAAAVVALV